MGLGVIAKIADYTFPSSSEVESHYWMQFNVLLRIRNVMDNAGIELIMSI